MGSATLATGHLLPSFPALLLPVPRPEAPLFTWALRPSYHQGVPPTGSGAGHCPCTAMARFHSAAHSGQGELGRVILGTTLEDGW